MLFHKAKEQRRVLWHNACIHVYLGSQVNGLVVSLVLDLVSLLLAARPLTRKIFALLLPTYHYHLYLLLQ